MSGELERREILALAALAATRKGCRPFGRRKGRGQARYPVWSRYTWLHYRLPGEPPLLGNGWPGPGWIQIGRTPHPGGGELDPVWGRPHWPLPTGNLKP